MPASLYGTVSPSIVSRHGHLLSISCATTSLNLFTVGRSLSPGTKCFSIVSLLQDRSKNKKLFWFQTDLLWQSAMAQEQLPFASL